MKPKKFTLEQLLENPSFCRLVKGEASDAEIEFWNTWQEADDRNRELVKQALLEINGFQVTKKKSISGADAWREFEKLNRVPAIAFRYPKKKIAWGLRVAAGFVFLLAVLISFKMFMQPELELAEKQVTVNAAQLITTGDGEQKTIRFTNAAKIVLNSNSTVRYISGNPIKVELLAGDVYFDSGKEFVPTNHVFEVQTPNGVLRDIGTKFWVGSMGENLSMVVLLDGGIELKTKESKGEVSQIISEKGDLLKFNSREVLVFEKVNPTYFTSWATGVMEFDNTPIKEFAKYVEVRFGVSVEISNKDLEKIELEGGVYFKSLEELVRSVSDVTGIPVYQSEDKKTVFIGAINSNNN